MSTTVLDALRNAQLNFENVKPFLSVSAWYISSVGLNQLENAIKALESGLTANDILQVAPYGEILMEPQL